MTLAICFVVHSGELEVKALLLAASLRHHWPASLELIACIPEGPLGSETSPGCLQALASLDVRITSVANPIGPDYPIGNKLLCLDVPTSAQRLLFLDSDTMAMGPADEGRLAAAFGQGFAAKPADIATASQSLATWTALYATAGLAMPQERVRATVSGETMPPYFNAGVIGVNANAGFGRLWADRALAIDRLPELPGRRPHLDQLSLPVAVAQSGLATHPIGEEWNFPANLRVLPEPLPMLCHYHTPQVIGREPALLDAVATLRIAAPEIGVRMESVAEWGRIAALSAGSVARPHPRRWPEGVITGIPRSGTSYLCRLLHDLEDQVVINEPSEVFALLRMRVPGHRLSGFYRELRLRILRGEAVANKTENGRIVADTAQFDARTAAPIPVGRDDFRLWTKNTLAYMSRLPQLLEAMPQARFVACLRHPLDTLASWKRTFPHLRDAAVESFPIGFPGDPQLPSAQRDELAAIAACSEPARRRALLWNHLAGILLEHRERLVLVHLEELAEHPRRVLERICHGPTCAAPEGAIQPWRSRSGGGEPPLPPEDLAAIGEECRWRANALGYDFP